MLKCEIWQVGKNFVYRLYREKACVWGLNGLAGARWQFIVKRDAKRPGQTRPGG